MLIYIYAWRGPRGHYVDLSSRDDDIEQVGPRKSEREAIAEAKRLALSIGSGKHVIKELEK